MDCKKALVIGHGSIGERHYQILSDLLGEENVHVVSRQKLQNIKSYINLEKVPDLNIYDYIVIASETHLHYQQLHYLNEHIKNKVILVEKPLFDRSEETLQLNNQVITAYNMRFHTVIEKLNEFIKHKQVYYVNIYCGSYLPRWRPKQDYREGYSADINRGGGVLRDLSHELDYISFLFGKLKTMYTVNTKISDLEITSDDLFTMLGITESKTVVNLSLDYISKIHKRIVLIHTREESIEADLIGNTIRVQNKNGEESLFSFPEVDRNYTYIEMHKAMIAGQFEKFCTLNEGLELVDLIDNIEFKEV